MKEQRRYQTQHNLALAQAPDQVLQCPFPTLTANFQVLRPIGHFPQRGLENA